MSLVLVLWAKVVLASFSAVGIAGTRLSRQEFPVVMVFDKVNEGVLRLLEKIYRRR